MAARQLLEAETWPLDSPPGDCGACDNKGQADNEQLPATADSCQLLCELLDGPAEQIKAVGQISPAVGETRSDIGSLGQEHHQIGTEDGECVTLEPDKR